MAEKPTAAVVWQRVEQLEATREESSARLHLEIDEVKRRVDALATLQADTSTRLTRQEATPIDVEQIRFPPKIVASAVAMVITIVGGMYASTYGLRSDVRDILTTMAQQKELATQKEALAIEKQKNSDERLQSLRDAVEMVDKQQKLQALETQGLKEMILRMQGGRRP